MVELLAICELRIIDDGQSAVAVRVHPAMIPRSHPLASVREAYDAVFVESEAAGQLMFYGPGAGGAPTASAVLGDLVTVARNLLEDKRGAGESAYADRAVLPMGETVTRYHVAIDVDDKAGVLATVALAFGSTASRSRPSVRRAATTTPSSSSSPTAPPTPSSPQRSSTSAASTSSARSPR